jgi:hypothetical protein
MSKNRNLYEQAGLKPDAPDTPENTLRLMMADWRRRGVRPISLHIDESRLS